MQIKSSIFGTMVQKKLNIEKFNARKLFSVVFAIFLLFSSCSTKRGIKSLLDIPISDTELALKVGGNKFASLSNNCLSCDDLQVLTIEIEDTSLFKNLSPATIQNAVYTGFLYSAFFEKPTEHTYSPPSILGEVPIYILFKKLILHNA